MPAQYLSRDLISYQITTTVVAILVMSTRFAAARYLVLFVPPPPGKQSRVISIKHYQTYKQYRRDNAYDVVGISIFNELFRRILSRRDTISRADVSFIFTT